MNSVKGGLPTAAHIEWRVILAPNTPELDAYKKFVANPKVVLDEFHLQCIQTGMVIPVQLAAGEFVTISCETVLDTDGQMRQEAAVSLQRCPLCLLH